MEQSDKLNFKYFRTAFAWLWSESRGVRLGVGLNALCGSLAAGSALLFVWTTKQIVDIATHRLDAGFTPYVTLLICSLLAQLLLTAASRRFEVKCTTRFSNRLRTRLFSHLMNSRWTGREHFHSGDAVNRLASDVGALSSLVSSAFPSAVATAVQLAAAFCFLAFLSVKVASGLVLIMLAALLLSKLYVRRTHRLTKEIREAESGVQRHLQEDLQHRVFITSMGLTERAVGQFSRLQEQFYKLVMRRNDLSLFAGTCVTAGFMAGYAVVFLWCAYGLYEGTVTFGMMTAFLQLVAQVQRPLVGLARRIPAFIQSSVSVERLDEIFSVPIESSGQEIHLEGRVGLWVSGVSFSYPDAQTMAGDVIADFTHDFAPSTLSAVVGPTGSGKTTLLMLLLGLLTPREGRVELYSYSDGHRFSVPAGVLSRCNITYVPQGNSLLSGTVRSNLLLGNPEATEAEMRAALHTAAADFVMELPSGLDTPCGERGTGLSEGQAQRIAIARGLLRKSGVLILDEPTSALDSATENTLISRLKNGISGRTVIIVTHHHSLLPQCDSIVFL